MMKSAHDNVIKYILMPRYVHMVTLILIMMLEWISLATSFYILIESDIQLRNSCKALLPLEMW